MHEEQQNDQIIGTAFKWSVIVLAALGLLGLAALLLYKNMQDMPEIEETATAIAPQVLSQTTARTVPDVKFTDITQDAGLRH